MTFTLSFPFRPSPAFRHQPKSQEITRFPFLPFRIETIHGRSSPLEALIDSGADHILIPRSTGEFLKLPRVGTSTKTSIGVGGMVSSYTTRFNLILGRGREVDLGPVEAQVLHDDLNLPGGREPPILFGRKPLFDLYQIIFEQYRDRFHLVPKENAVPVSLRGRGKKKRR